MPALTGYAPTDWLVKRYLGEDGMPPTTATTAYGTQAAPLDAFYGQGGSTGNKTTNADLPVWLRALGMKGDAYAGGMLKPEIRYGFAFKNGKIHFADGTSFAAKKTKGEDGKVAYSYTGADGKATTYSPTDEQNAYNKAYKASTSNQSFLDKAKNTVNFELWHGKQILKGIGKNPLQSALFGIDPIGTKIGNKVFGNDAKPLVDQLGGANADRYEQYGRPTGFAEPLQGVAHTIAAMYGARGLGNAAGNVFGGAAPGGPTGGDLGVFSNGGQGGLTNVGVGNAGVLANSGVIQGGAGVAGIAGLGGGTGAAGGGAGAGMGVGASGGSWMDWVGSLISAGSSIIGTRQANNASDAATRAVLGEQRRQFDLVRSDTAPARALGAAAIGRLADVNGYNESGTPNMSAFTTSPDYVFNLTEGQKAIDRSAAARGGLLSGAAVKEGTRYASGMASREYSAFIDRLMQQAGLGSTGIGASAAAGANAANVNSSALLNAGNARASAYMNNAANVNNSIQQGFENYTQRRYLYG